MSSMLPEGATLRISTASSPVRVIRCLGGGGQGQVFEVDFAGEPMAVKWYYPSCIAKDRGLKQRLKDCLQAAEPNANFLWPIVLLEPSEATLSELTIPAGSFGYMMKLRPPNYVGAIEHTSGRLAISLRQVLRACFFLAEAFHALHSKGFCYKDISLGNLFLDPSSGRVLICDNDNVDIDGRNLGSAVGTPGFMAPEVLLGRSKPGSLSDRFSLAVLIFRLLTRHDPYKGSLELQIRCLDEPARRRLYGEDPVFIFAANDSRNRPDPLEHPAPLLTWPIYPPHLQKLFQQSLGEGAKDPARRAYTGQWMQALARSLDQRSLCPHCGQEVFLEAGQLGSCWACGHPIRPSPHFLTPQGPVLAQIDNELHPHHFDPVAAPCLDHPLGRVEAHPLRRSLLGLKNLSTQIWTAELENGETLPVAPEQRCSLEAISRLRTSIGTIQFVR